MSTLKVSAITNASNTGTANLSLDASGNATVGNTLAMGSSFLRNKLINGDMRIDQRNAGASVNAAGNKYTLDRWQFGDVGSATVSVQQNAGSVTPPAGFSYYLGLTSTSSYSLGTSDRTGIFQSIEGLNTYDLGWGTANAKTITISFWVRSSLTGTFGGVIANSAYNRCYVYSYTINAANTWEFKTITVAGDTSGTWLTTNGIGIAISFATGVGSSLVGTPGSWGSSALFGPTGQTSVVGTNGATFYITGVQLEVGSIATPFERRQYGQELMLCQRYYETSSDAYGSDSFFWSGYVVSSISYYMPCKFVVTKRATPTVTLGAQANLNFPTNASVSATSIVGFYGQCSASATGNVGYFRSAWTASAEL